MPELSVIVVTLKPPDEILCVPEFKKSDFDDYELIIRQDEGISTARNEGIAEASSDKIVFIDDDAVPTEGYLQAAASVLDEEDAVVGRIIHPGSGVISKLASPYYPDGDEGEYVPFVIGCNMAFRREVFETVGYFDEKFNWGHEEMELSERISDEYSIYYEPSMCVIHAYAEGILDYWRTRYRFGPADIHRSRQRGLSEWEILLETFHPKWYFHPVLPVLPVAAIGGLIENVSRLRTLYREQAAGTGTSPTS